MIKWDLFQGMQEWFNIYKTISVGYINIQQRKPLTKQEDNILNEWEKIFANKTAKERSNIGLTQRSSHQVSQKEKDKYHVI